MKFAGVEETNIDYPGKQALILFTPRCNYKCPAGYCRGIANAQGEIDEESVYERFRRNNWLDGVVICGGEPTIHPDLPRVLGNFKKMGLAVKLDTNGTDYMMLGKLIEEKLVDYVAMDIKAPLNLWKRVAGVEGDFDFRDRVEKGAVAVTRAKNYEFRTTVVPVFTPEVRWFTGEETRSMAEWMKNLSAYDLGRWYVQPFIAMSQNEMNDARFAKENLPREFHRTPQAKLEEMRDIISSVGFKAEIRGRGA